MVLNQLSEQPVQKRLWRAIRREKILAVQRSLVIAINLAVLASSGKTAKQQYVKYALKGPCSSYFSARFATSICATFAQRKPVIEFKFPGIRHHLLWPTCSRRLSGRFQMRSGLSNGSFGEQVTDRLWPVTDVPTPTICVDALSSQKARTPAARRSVTLEHCPCPSAGWRGSCLRRLPMPACVPPVCVQAHRLGVPA